MKNIQYLIDADGTKKGIMLNISENPEGKILDFWLSLSYKKRNLANLFFAKLLLTGTIDNFKKASLNDIITEIERMGLNPNKKKLEIFEKILNQYSDNLAERIV